jgi:general stress protein 26
MTSSTSAPHENPHVDDVKRLRELLQDFDVGMLITLGDDELHARPMAVAEVTPDGRISFATARHSRKADEVMADERVAISFQGKNRFVFVIGTADLHQDRARIDQLWQESWRTWFPNGADDPDLHILEVFPVEAEVWDLKGARGARYIFEAARALLKGERAREPEGVHENLIIP